MEQKTAIAHEAKAVLDSWVRYEGQVKQRQQRELAESVIAKIEKELENPKTLKQILDQSVADVESMSFAFGFVIIKADKLQESCRKRHKRQNYQSPFKSSQCYINLCNSQSGPIDYQSISFWSDIHVGSLGDLSVLAKLDLIIVQMLCTRPHVQLHS